MNIPKTLRYTKEHEWAKPAGQTAIVGITEFAVEQLGDITLVELPAVGRTVKAGEAIGVIESVKAVSDLFSPLSGTVQKVNQQLENAPEKVNEDPYGEGWMIELKIKSPAEVEALLNAEAYQAHLNSLEE